MDRCQHSIDALQYSVQWSRAREESTLHSALACSYASLAAASRALLYVSNSSPESICANTIESSFVVHMQSHIQPTNEPSAESPDTDSCLIVASGRTNLTLAACSSKGQPETEAIDRTVVQAASRRDSGFPYHRTGFSYGTATILADIWCLASCTCTKIPAQLPHSVVLVTPANPDLHN